MEYEDELERMRAKRGQKRSGRQNPERRSQSVRSQRREYESDDYEELDYGEIGVRETVRQERKVRPARRNDVEARKKQRAQAIRRKKRKRKILIVEVAVLVVLVAFAFFFFKQKTQSGYWTIAVFGVDSRDGNLKKGAISDVEMICNIDRATGEIKLVSVFRDTYLKIDSKGTYHKINQAYHKGGPSQAIDALNENLDLKIDDYATFNWSSVAQAINILGGIDLEITDKEFKYMNSFITETVESTKIPSVHLEHAGMNHLDGVQAVAYSRLRLMDTDFNRTERQRKVVTLALEKAKQADFSVLNNILVTVLPQISTSIGVGDLIPIAQGLSKYHMGDSAGFPFARTTTKIGKLDCVIPLTLESNVSELHKFLFGIEDYKPSSGVRKISDRIAKDSGMGEVGENAPTGGNQGGGGNQTQATKPPETAPAESSPEVETTEEMTTEEETTAEEETTQKATQEDGSLVGPGAGSESEPATKPSKPAVTESSKAEESKDAEIGPGASPTVKETTAASLPEEKTSEANENSGPGV